MGSGNKKEYRYKNGISRRIRYKRKKVNRKAGQGGGGEGRGMQKERIARKKTYFVLISDPILYM